MLRDALGLNAETRAQQRAYAETAVHAFAARQSPAFNNILIAEAGTGLGKTIGYLAPAWAWSRKNAAPVWLSTYTKNLQRQLDQETARLLRIRRSGARRLSSGRAATISACSTCRSPSGACRRVARVAPCSRP